MERSIIFHGTTHYFYDHFQQLCGSQDRSPTGYWPDIKFPHAVGSHQTMKYTGRANKGCEETSVWLTRVPDAPHMEYESLHLHQKWFAFGNTYDVSLSYEYPKKDRTSPPRIHQLNRHQVQKFLLGTPCGAATCLCPCSSWDEKGKDNFGCAGPT